MPTRKPAADTAYTPCVAVIGVPIEGAKLDRCTACGAVVYAPPLPRVNRPAVCRPCYDRIAAEDDGR